MMDQAYMVEKKAEADYRELKEREGRPHEMDGGRSLRSSHRFKVATGLWSLIVQAITGNSSR